MPPTLEAFRTALHEEMDTARKGAGSSAVTLLNGKRINAGARVLYLFRLESPLDAMDDAPADLAVGDRRVAAIIVSLDGLAVTLSVEEDLGDFIPRAALVSDMTLLLRKLIERIEALAAMPNPGGDRLLGKVEPTGTADARFQVEGLNRSRLAAAQSILGRDLTWIWGPPGTGKTQVIGAVGAECIRRKQSLLVVSHTNIAVDNAILRIARLLGADPEDGSLIRLGDPKDPSVDEHPNLLARTHVERRSAELVARRTALQVRQVALKASLQTARSRVEQVEWVRLVVDELAVWRSQLGNWEAAQENVAKLEASHAEMERHEEQWQALTREVKTAEAAQFTLERRRAQATTDLAQVAAAKRDVEAARRTLAEGTALLARAEATNGLIRRWRGLPTPDAQRAVVDGAGKRLAQCQQALTDSEATLRLTETDIVTWEAKAGEIEQRYKEPLASLAAKVERYEQAFAASDAAVGDGRRTAKELRRTLVAAMAHAVDALVEFDPGFADRVSTPQEAIEAIAQAHARLAAEVVGLDAEVLRAEIEASSAELDAIVAGLTQIEEELLRVEELVVAEAVVVATTLTRAFLRPSLLKRRFDTVLLDEASMAPIPALWAAAALADRAVAAVGDFRQLAPIVQSQHPLARKWLGHDIFEESGVQAAYEAGSPPAHFIILDEQRRMHPDISRIANDLVYDRRLKDELAGLQDDPLKDWYDRAWGHDAPVLLVDTGPAHPWVTSGGRNGSRFNFLSASFSVALADRMLRPDRVPHNEREAPRILIVSPYRAHARLVGVLLKDRESPNEVLAGTTHSFQGKEAPVVLLDLVNGEPHRLAGMFDAAHFEDDKRLLNVALTRAQRRLVVIADFGFIRRCANSRSFLRTFVDYLTMRYPTVAATTIGGMSLAASAARLAAIRSGALPDADYLVVSQADYFDALAADLSAAKHEVIIFSPYMTTSGLARLEPALRGAVARGVRVTLMTKPLTERNRTEAADAHVIESALAEWGVNVLHKRYMHEKIVFVDDGMVWVGSLNTMSQRDSQEMMTRFRNTGLAADMRKQLRLGDILETYERGDGLCPVCQGELTPAEGTRGGFWRCINGDYTRDFDTTAPRNGLIPCASPGCGAPQRFGSWGAGYAWRCEVNPRHHQRVYPSHLKLPKMAAMVPAAAARQLRAGRDA